MLDLCLVAWVLSLMLRRTCFDCNAPIYVCNMSTSGICDLRKSSMLACNSRSLQLYSKVNRVYAFGVPVAEIHIFQDVHDHQAMSSFLLLHAVSMFQLDRCSLELNCLLFSQNMHGTAKSSLKRCDQNEDFGTI